MNIEKLLQEQLEKGESSVLYKICIGTATETEEDDLLKHMNIKKEDHDYETILNSLKVAFKMGENMAQDFDTKFQNQLSNYDILSPDIKTGQTDKKTGQIDEKLDDMSKQLENLDEKILNLINNFDEVVKNIEFS